MYSQSSFNVGVTVLKITTYSKTKECFSRQKLITVPENLDTEDKPAVRKKKL